MGLISVQKYSLEQDLVFGQQVRFCPELLRFHFWLRKFQLDAVELGISRWYHDGEEMRDKAFSEKLYQLRKKRGYSQEQLARELVVSRQAISRWKLGEWYQIPPISGGAAGPAKGKLNRWQGKRGGP